VARRVARRGRTLAPTSSGACRRSTRKAVCAAFSDVERVLKPSILLRVAAGMFAFIAAGHTVGMFAKSRGIKEDLVVRAMQAYEFDVMGSRRTHWDFYRGEGWYVTLACAVFAVVLWQLASMSKANPAGARPLLWTMLVAAVISSALNGVFFFIAPLLSSIIATVCIAVAAASLQQKPEAPAPAA